MIPEHFTFKYLKARVSIAAVLQDKGLNTAFRKRADQLVGPCPVHGGDNPNAFVISLSKNIWHCFTQCNAGGDVVELVRRLDSKTYRADRCIPRIFGQYPQSFIPGSPNPHDKGFSPLHQISDTERFNPLAR